MASLWVPKRGRYDSGSAAGRPESEVGTDVRRHLVTECLRYSLRPETKNTGSGEEVKALPDTIKMLKTRVEELEKSEGALKGGFVRRKRCWGEMKSKLEERFGGEW